MLQNMGIVKHFWGVKNFEYRKIKCVISKQNGAGIAYSVQWLGKGWTIRVRISGGASHILFFMPNVHTGCGAYPTFYLMHTKVKGQGSEVYSTSTVPSLRMSKAIMLPYFCSHVVGKGKSLHFFTPKNVADISFIELYLSRFIFGLALRCHVLTYCTCGSRFTEFGHPFCRNP